MTPYIYTIQDLAQQLGIKEGTLRRQAIRYGLPESLTTPQARTLVAPYATPRTGRPPRTVQAAEQFMASTSTSSSTATSAAAATSSPTQNVQVNVYTPDNAQDIRHLPDNSPTNPGQTPDKPTTTPRWRGNTPQATPQHPTTAPAGAVVRVARSEAVLVLLFLSVAAWQVLNTAEVVAWAGGQGFTATWRAIMFAAPVQLAALLLTIHNGSRAYLAAFAGFEFSVNMLHYRPWQAPTWEIWAVAILLSAFIAFTIFSFSEIFARKQ